LRFEVVAGKSESPEDRKPFYKTGEIIFGLY